MKKVFDTPGEVDLDIRVPAGRVELFASDRTDTEVEVTPLAGDDASVEAAENCIVDGQEQAGRAMIRIEVPKRGRRWLAREPHVLLTVKTRTGAGVEIQTGSADVDARGQFGSMRGKTASGEVDVENAGDVQFSSASGDVNVGEARGACKVETASGDIAVQAIKDRAVIRSASGAVRVREAAAGIKVQTASGDVELAAVTSGQVALQSASGDLRIGIARGSTVWVDAKSLSGETTSDLDVGGDPPDIDGPHIDLQATSMSGDIHIARAAAFH